MLKLINAALAKHSVRMLKYKGMYYFQFFRENGDLVAIRCTYRKTLDEGSKEMWIADGIAYANEIKKGVA